MATLASVVPFIVLCGARTGSNMLVEVLAQHPEIEAYIEPLNVRVHGDAVRGRRARESDDGAAFVRHIFSPVRPEVRAAGFKILYAQAQQGALATAWRELESREDLVVIDLVRENLLEMLVSHRLAEFTGRWKASFQGGRPAPERVVLSFHDCHEYFADYAAQRHAAIARFRGRRILPVSYEELCGKTGAVVGRICEALGVAPHQPRAVSEKQERKAMRERLENYAELQRAFAGSAHARYFA